MCRKAGQGGIPGAGLLRILFALSFCPVSAVLFIGSLIPLSVSGNSSRCCSQRFHHCSIQMWGVSSIHGPIPFLSSDSAPAEDS